MASAGISFCSSLAFKIQKVRRNWELTPKFTVVQSCSLSNLAVTGGKRTCPHRFMGFVALQKTKTKIPCPLVMILFYWIYQFKTKFCMSDITELQCLRK